MGYRLTADASRRVAKGFVSVAMAGTIAVMPDSRSLDTEVPRGPEAAPNVLLVITDDQRARGTLGVMPKTRDAFGKGRVFDAAATTPLCCPSRASIFTGQYTHNHGLVEEYDDPRFDDDRPGFHDKTIQRYLHDAGYETALFGKYLNGWRLSDDPPNLDSWAISRGTFYENATWNVDGRVRELEGYHTTLLKNLATRFIDENEADDAKPWFLVVATVAPHPPAVPEGKYARAPVPKFDTPRSFMERRRGDKPPVVRDADVSEREVRRDRRAQLRALMSVDDLVGGVLRHLERRGETNTLAIYMSDNGYMWGEHGLLGKALAYKGSTDIPLLLRWPSVVEPGRDRRPAANIDVAPTILEAAGIESEHDLDGRSLLRSWRRDRLLAEFFGHREVGRWAATLTPRYRYVEHYSGDRDVVFREYYDLIDDPAQLRNLLGDRTRRNDPNVRSLSYRLQRDRRCRTSSECP